MRLLVLGYVFDLDFSTVPKGDEIGIKAHRRDTHYRQVKRLSYGEVQTGVLVFTREGVTLQDWFEGGEYRVGDAPPDFTPNGANGGNPITGYDVNGSEVSLYFSDDFWAIVNVEGSWGTVVDTAGDFESREEERYALQTARALWAWRPA